MGKDNTNSVSRAERKVKKRKLEDAIPDLPGDIDGEGIGGAEVEGGEKAEKKKNKKRKVDDGDEVVENGDAEGKENKKDKKKRRKIEEEASGEREAGEEVKVKKSKKAKKDVVVEEEKVEEKAEETNGGDEAPKKSKKERKAERRAKELAEAAEEAKKTKAVEEKSVTVEAADETEGTKVKETSEEKKARKNNRNREKKRKGEAAATGANGEGAEKKGESKAARFIVFIGNLPFTANVKSITSHFASVKPLSVRPLTEKANPTKCKGCAFIEFSGYDHMKTCLKLFHHSIFDDGVSAPRKINVELTAGGGGNTKQRKGKIVEKNEKLNEERVRKIQEEEKAKAEKAANPTAKGVEKKKEEPKLDESGIHPSRRARVAFA